MKLRAGTSYYPATIEVEGGTINLSFKYYAALVDEVKSTFGGRRYNPDKKNWNFPITPRNLFRLEAMLKDGENPYKPYDDIALRYQEVLAKVKEYAVSKGLTGKRKLYDHQYELITNALISRAFIWAADMGLGKSLASIIVMEMSGITDWFWAAPRGPLVAARAEFLKWGSSVQPQFMTYESLRSLIGNWPSGKAAPCGVIFDEASRLKNPSAKRTVAAMHLTESIRKEHPNFLIGALTGTPAPKSPVDWWALCEVVCPGYVREGNPVSFMERLAITEQRETVHGAGSYRHIVGWRDSTDKCNKCGQPKEHINHATDKQAMMLAVVSGAKQTSEPHPFIPCKNEVAALAHRLRGLVTVKLKKDCLDLPDLRFKVIECKPTQATINAAKLIVRRSTRAIQALTLLRELSDGFQYVERPTGEQRQCEGCGGNGKIVEYYNAADPSIYLSDDEIKEGVRYIWSECPPEDDPDVFIPIIVEKIPIKIEENVIECPACEGNKTVPVMERTVSEFPCPKDEVLINLLDEHYDVGRFVVYGGFSGTIDRVTRICLEQDWTVVRVDGRGWAGVKKGGVFKASSDTLLDMFSNKQEEHPRVVFVGQPGAAGMGLTLTASPSIFFYSNDFNGESRQQAIHRGHRIGMDVERGGQIIDCIHLDSDRVILDNLKKKSDLQHLSMKGLKDAIES